MMRSLGLPSYLVGAPPPAQMCRNRGGRPRPCHAPACGVYYFLAPRTAADSDGRDQGEP